VDANRLQDLARTELGSSRLLEAAIAWEMGSGRKVKPDDEPVIRDYLKRMDEATAAQKTAASS
jgi:hypothetical protein